MEHTLKDRDTIQKAGEKKKKKLTYKDLFEKKKVKKNKKKKYSK